MTSGKLSILLAFIGLAIVGCLVGGPWLARALDSTTKPAPALLAVDLRVRVIVANIRIADPKDKDNAWPLRRDLLVKTLLDHKPDLVGFQEVTPAQGIFLQREMKDYTFVTSGEKEDIATAMLSGLDTLAFRKDRFTLVSSAAGLIRPDAIQPTVTENALYTLAVITDSHKVFPDIIFLNTHIRHEGPNAVACAERLRQILAEQLKAHPDAAVIVTSDFNHDRTESCYAALLNFKTPGPTLADTFDYTAKKPDEHWGTFHNFTGKAVSDLPTDLIFVSGLAATPAEILRDHSADNHFPSDHFFVTTELRLPGK